MTAGAPCRFLEWDSAHFGRRIGRIEKSRLSADTLKEVAAWCAAERIDCVYFLAEPGDGDSVRVAAQAGFRQVDLRVTLERDNTAPGDAVEPDRVRLYEPADLPRLREIARVRHAGTRFYRDPGFDRDRCAELYDLWISKACAGGSPRVFVALSDRQPAGYLTCQVAGGGRIDLVAVAEAAQGKGLGRALVLEALRWFAEQPLDRVSVVTQGDNAAARRLYEGCGFRTRSEQVYFHGWFGPGGKGRP